MALLGRLLASFWLSWDACWTHFGSLGTSWDAFFAQVGPSWPKIPKKTWIFEFNLRKLAQVGTQKWRKIDAENDVFLRCIFDIDFYRFLVDFGLGKSTFWGSIFELKAKLTILKKVSSRLHGSTIFLQNQRFRKMFDKSSILISFLK